MSNHEHRWAFLIAKGSYVPVRAEANEPIYKFVEYAYMICNGCTNVIKERVKAKEEV